jgi:hypothetical protein
MPQPGDAMEAATRQAVEFTETVGMFAIVRRLGDLRGRSAVGPVLRAYRPRGVVYAGSSASRVIRILPVALALSGDAPASRHASAFIGWFGPRGLASVVFSLIALHELARTPVARRCSTSSAGRSSARSFSTA